MRQHSHIGPYELLAVIGQGSTGMVYRAEHKVSGEHVALKTVHLPDVHMLTTIRHEIHALSRLQHPGIVKILEHGVHEGHPWYAMELVSGVRLQDYHLLISKVHTTSDTWEGDSPQDTVRMPGLTVDIETTLPDQRDVPSFDEVTPTRPSDALTQARAAQWLAELTPPTNSSPTKTALADQLRSLFTLIRRICEPLAYLHGEGFVHCDLKPDNILIRDNGFPVLLDFGLLQRFRARFGREHIDPTIHHGGTPLYMAPEQIMHMLLDARADLYSLGCIFYELLTGQPPYRGKAQEVLAQHLFGSPRLPSHDFPDLTEEIDELLLQLLARDPRQRIGYADTLAARLEAMGADPTPYPNAPPAQIYLYPPGLVGRQEPLQQLQDTLKSLAEPPGKGQMVWLSGPSGIGKTRLASVFTRWARFQKIRVISSTCHEHSPHLLEAFRPLLVAVADDIREKGADEQERMLGHRLPVLGMYEPSLLSLPYAQDATPTLLPPQEASLRLSRYLSEVVAAFAGSLPMVLFLDDLQWADEPTIAALQYLLQHGLPPAVMIVGAYRSEEIPLPLHNILQHPSAQHLELHRLEEQDVEMILRDMLCLETPPSLWSRSLCYQSAGNPLFIVEYIRAAVEDGDFFRDSQGRWQFAGPQHQAGTRDATQPHFSIPLSLRDLLKRRLNQISAPARLFASCVSVLGQDAPLSLLQAMSAQDEWEMVEILQELQQSKILVQRSTGRVHFVHEPMRHLAYELLNPAVKKTLHRKAAECLEAAPNRYPTLYHDVGHHWEQAGENIRAREGYTHAAGQAAAGNAHDEAASLYQQALYLAPKGHESEIQLRIALGESLSHLGRYQAALQYYKEAVALGEAQHNASLRSMSMYQEAATLARLGHWEEAQGVFTQVLEFHRAHSDRKKQGQLLGDIANVVHEQGDLHGARELYQEALVILRDSGERREEGIVLGSLATVLHSQGLLEQAIAHFEQALEIHRAGQNRYAEALTMTNLGVTHSLLQRHAIAQELLEESLHICRTIGHRHGEGFALGHLAHVLHLQGETERPLRFLQQAIQIMSDTHSALFEGIFRIYQHKIQRRLGISHVTLQNHLTLAQECLQSLGKTPYLILLYCERGHLKLMQQQPANDCLLRALAYARRSKIASNTTTEWSQAITRLQRAILAHQQNQPLWHGEHPICWPRKLTKPANVEAAGPIFRMLRSSVG